MPPNGPQQLLTVVGIVRESLLVFQRFQPAAPDGEVDSIYTQTHFLFLTSAWWREQHDDVLVYGAFTAVHIQPAASAATIRQGISDRLPGFVFPPDDGGPDTRALRNTVDLQSNAALLVGLVAIVASLVFVGQAIVRQANHDLDDEPTFAALGMTRKLFASATLLRWAPIALGAAMTAVVGAILLSPLGPIGAGRIAEPTPGIRLDWPVLVLGFAGVATTVVLCGMAPTLSRRRSRGTQSIRPRNRLGIRIPSQISGGPRLLDAPGHRRPLAVGIGCTALVVACFVASAGLVTSLAGLTSHPDRYGAHWDFCRRQRVGRPAIPSAD